MLEAFIIALFTMFGVITQRVVGFGIAPFLGPVALIFLAPPNAIATTIFVGTISCIIILFQVRHNFVVIPKVIGRILMAAIPGLLIGANIVIRIDKALLQVIVGAIVITAVLIQEYFFPHPTRKLGVTRGITASGFFAGLMNATAANGAPPMAMWLRSHAITPDQMRQHIAAMFIVVNLSSLTALHYLRPQTFDSQLLATLALLVPVIIFGNFIGTILMKRVNVKLFQKLVIGVIILTGAVSIGLGLVNVF